MTQSTAWGWALLRRPPPDGRKLFGGDNCHGVFIVLDLALVGTLEGGADGDDPAWT